MHEAVSSTLELESYLAKPRSGSISHEVSHVAVPDEPPVESIQAVQRDMIGTMQKLVERVEKLEVATKQRYPVVQGRGVDMPPRRGRGRQWDIWDRVMPENNGMDKEATYRLVGVDGIPI